MADAAKAGTKEGAKAVTQAGTEAAKAAKPETATQAKVAAAVAKAVAKATKAKELKVDPSYDPWTVLRYPHLAEKSVRQVESDNRLVFLVDKKATKAQVRAAVEKGFGAAVLRVNIQVTPRGEKKASVTLAAGVSALDIATRLGML